jgi:hypothetical protein
LFQTSSYGSILKFCGDVTNIANDDIVDAVGVGVHYTNHTMHHQAIENLLHLIECRNIIAAARESLGEMRSADYCGDYISLLVLDRTRIGVAKLVRIESAWIEGLALAFEACLFQVISQDAAMVLFNNITLLASDLTAACKDLLVKLDLNIESADTVKDIWRRAVHVLDIAVLSYSVAHTEFPDDRIVPSVTIPGPFQEKQYYRFCRRSFLCIGEFLGGQEAWVLESLPPGAPQIDRPPLSLSTDAETFGDIWGPMWKSLVHSNNDDAEEERIVRYHVGNGVILPWSPPLPNSLDIRKGEVFCHWKSDKERHWESAEEQCQYQGFANSSTFKRNDVLLIGAPVISVVNDQCRYSVAHQRQKLRDLGALSEPGTIRYGRVLASELIQAEVGGPYARVGVRLQYKRRGQTFKQAWIESWKHNPQSRHVGYLEHYLGLEVSPCTYNARRVRLIELFRTSTMLNHLENGSLQWQNNDCKKHFFSAIQDEDYTAFRKLYESSEANQQTDLGNAIGYGLTTLQDTGKNKEDLELFWAPEDRRPGLKVALKSSDHSWIGFLEETVDNGTLAILGDRCLELSLPDIGKKCQHAQLNPRHITTNLFTSGNATNGSILETSVHLNDQCVPTSLSKEIVRQIPRDGFGARQPSHWNVSLLEEGYMFGFGEKGFLETFTPLNHGQILAKWTRSPGILRAALRTIRQRRQTPMIHHECIRDDDEILSPVRFFIISTATNNPDSSHPPRRPPFGFMLNSVEPRMIQHPSHFSASRQTQTEIGGVSTMTVIAPEGVSVEPDTLHTEHNLTINGSSVLITDAVGEDNGSGCDILHYHHEFCEEARPRSEYTGLIAIPNCIQSVEPDTSKAENTPMTNGNSILLINSKLEENSVGKKSDSDPEETGGGDGRKQEPAGAGKILNLDRKGKARE